MGWAEASLGGLLTPWWCLSAAIMQCSALFPGTSQAAAGLWPLYRSIVHHLAQQHMYAVIFSPLYLVSLYLLLEEIFVQVCRHYSKKSWVSAYLTYIP